MNREKAEAFVEAALVELEKCKTDMQVAEWDSIVSTSREYLELPVDLIKKLESGYDQKVRWICGVGGG